MIIFYRVLNGATLMHFLVESWGIFCANCRGQGVFCVNLIIFSAKSLLFHKICLPLLPK